MWVGSSMEQRLYIPFGTQRPCCTEKFCSWAEETSIWLRNNTITQSNFWPLHWPSTLILLHFNIFFWKRDSVREEKILQKVLLTQWLKRIAFRCLLGAEHATLQCRHGLPRRAFLGSSENGVTFSLSQQRSYQNIWTISL